MTTANRDPIALNFSTSWAYAPAPESAGHAKIAPRYELFIDGQFVAPMKGEYFDTTNPATEKKLAAVALATPDDVDKAVNAARRAYDKTWSRMPAIRTAASAVIGTRPVMLLVGYLAVFMFGFANGRAPLRHFNNELLNLPVRWDEP